MARTALSHTLELGSLRLVRAIADAGSITGAAASLGYTQPAVSQHVRRLEQRLGTALLERTPRGVRLTEAGQVLARCGARVAAGVDAAEREISALTGLQTGVVRVVAFPTASAVLVPAALTQLRELAPRVAVRYVEAEPPESVEAVREGRCDIALSYGAVEDDGIGDLRCRQLLLDPCVLALADDHPLAGRRRLHLRDLADARWIVGRHRLGRHLTAAAAQAGFTPLITIQTDDYVATFAFVAAGLGVALLPGLISTVAARHPGITLRSVSGGGRLPVFALTRPDLLRVPAVAATLDALQDAAASTL